MFWNVVQWLLNRFIIGQHYWLSHPKELIIGFRVTEQKWAGKPNLAGWDYPLGTPQPIAYFLNINDAKCLEEKRRTSECGPICYDIEPIQVRIPKLRVLVFWARARKQLSSIVPKVRNAYRRWNYYRHQRACGH